MKYIAMMLVLMLASCGPSVQGGNITGKYTKLEKGGLIKEDRTLYFLQLTKHGQTGEVEVTKEAWDQAKSGMVWPFEVR